MTDNFCFLCNEKFNSSSPATQSHDSHSWAVGHIFETELDNTTKLNKFLDYLCIDILKLLAISGGVAANAVVMHHFNFSLLEGVIEGLGFGFLLGFIVCKK